MDKLGKAVTIKQVAEEVGVSIGTVDRALHNRGRVSAETRQKVLDAVSRLGFSPDIRASILSRKKELRIIVILPLFQNGDFWSMLENGIRIAISKFKNLNLETKFIYYEQFSEKSFDIACRDCLKHEPDAVVMSPIFRDRSAVLVRDLNKAGIPVVFLDTKVDDCPYTTFYGINLEASAYILADLIFRDGKKPEKIFEFYIEHKNAPLGEAFSKRNEGFKAYLLDNDIDCEIVQVPFSASDFLRNIKMFDKVFSEYPDIRYGITMTSRANIISDWLALRQIRDFRLYGFDATPANVSALKKGYINTLISQRSSDEARDAVENLITYLVTGINNDRRDVLYPIDILTKYNADFYDTHQD